jgi:hypothetical protein
MPYRIVFEEPPASRSGEHSGHSELINFLTNLDENHRGKWARLAKSRKHISYIYNLRKNRFPNMEIVSRRNNDRTFGVWVRFHDAPVKVRNSGGRKATVKGKTS